MILRIYDTKTTMEGYTYSACMKKLFIDRLVKKKKNMGEEGFISLTDISILSVHVTQPVPPALPPHTCQHSVHCHHTHILPLTWLSAPLLHLRAFPPPHMPSPSPALLARISSLTCAHARLLFTTRAYHTLPFPTLLLKPHFTVFLSRLCRHQQQAMVHGRLAFETHTSRRGVQQPSSDTDSLKNLKENQMRPQPLSHKAVAASSTVQQ